jgi:hypothetical protein
MLEIKRRGVWRRAAVVKASWQVKQVNSRNSSPPFTDDVFLAISGQVKLPDWLVERCFYSFQFFLDRYEDFADCHV